MTTPTPALTALLDELDQLRAAALSIRSDYPSLPMLEQHGTEVAACWSDGADMAWVDCEHPADAALIVAAVNAVPRFTAALRAALAHADELEREGVALAARSGADFYARHWGYAKDTAAQRLRSALAAALEPTP